jgi:predicted nucleic acid-binding protein
MIVVDSSVWIAFFRAEKRASTLKLLSLLSSGEIIVGDIILLELLQGARDHTHANHIEKHLRTFQIANMLDTDLAVMAAWNYRELRRKGITIRKSADLIIGTFCIEHGHSLLQHDRDFMPMHEHLGLKLL